MTRVSVLIPCFNAAAHLEAALESVLRQTWEDVEVIVTNDGSTDASEEILRKYEARGIIVVRQQNQGQCAAANTAYKHCTGDLIKFFDADDIIAPDMIELQVKRLAGRRDAIALGEWRRFYGRKPDEGTFPRLAMYRDANPVDWIVQEWARARPMMQCGLWLIPRSIIEERGLWDERLSLINDFEYFARLLLGATEILYAPGAQMFYRSGLANSLSGQKSRKAVESAYNSLVWGTNYLLAAEDSPRTRLVSANVLLDFEYTYFPEHRDLRRMILRRVRELGGADLEPDGPPGFQRLRKFIGWRNARRVQRFAERLRMNRAARTRMNRSEKLNVIA